MNQRKLITSALPYANGYIHLGHCAGAYLPADIYARYARLVGDDVLFICGSDEHGVAITIAAEKEKVTPKDIIDKYHYANKAAFDKFGMSFDYYSRTSIDSHHEIAREFFADFLKKKYLIAKEEEQLFDEEAQMFLPDRYVEGTCPNCGYDAARGDQCDKCGSYYNQTELINPISLISHKTPIKKITRHWYFQFSQFQEFLEKYIESHSKDWKDNVLQQTRSWLNVGLTERAITRDLIWGVKLTGIEGLSNEEVEGKALYVWFDAVLGYISATIEYFKEKGADANEWRNWWQSEETKYLAFIGKDNIVFHTLIFPAMLHARYDDQNKYILPNNVPANEFLNLEGQKFSKSRNWSIDLKDFFEDFTEPQYVDTLRYALAMNFPESKDSDFTWKDFQARNNNELAAILGNFINRTLQFTIKNFDSKVPTFTEIEQFTADWKSLINDDEAKTTALNENDKLLINSLAENIDEAIINYEKYRFRDAISNTMNIARAANKYFNDEEPWKSIKQNPEQTAKTMYACCQMVVNLACVFAPILPHISNEIFEIFNHNTTFNHFELKSTNYFEIAKLPSLAAGANINEPRILITKIENEQIQAQTAKLGTPIANDKKKNTTLKTIDTPPINTNLINYDKFRETDLRTAKVIEAENVPKSKKLLRLQVEVSGEKRQIIAGVAEHYAPSDLIGKTIIIVANLEPAKIMGMESQGMLLAANTSDGKIRVVTLDDDILTGAEVR